MVQCPTCGSEVSEQATFCPDCGTDLKPAGAPPAPAPAGGAETPAATAPAEEAAAPPPAEPELGIEEEPANAPAAATAPAAPTASEPPASTGESGAATAVGARLILKRSGAATNEVFPIGGHVTLGRFDAETGPVDVDLGNLPEATYVSRQHAEMIPDASGTWKIKDLGSRNGVFVRKQGGTFQRVTGEETVNSGDEIALGNARFELRIG
jgi:pSer/pThr/pTyr-binding forkhead associated (FHA) protein